MRKYLAKNIEPKWQEKWREEKVFSPNLNTSKNPYYNLWMFPYPSGEGLHVGHFYASVGSDIYGRFNRMMGFDIFQPIGYDAFGIHSENYSLKVDSHPMELIDKTIDRYEKQLIQTGNSYDWEHTVNTSKKDYYKWTQWLFLQLFKANLAYRKKAQVNWCPSCLTVLADEQVISGSCERCESEVEKKYLEQWFLKITDYADRLLDNLAELDWSEKIKVAQTNWIGKSEGSIVRFDQIEVFTTRVDTIFGATFIVLSPEYSNLAEFVTSENKNIVEGYIKDAINKSELERKENKEKSGVFTGSYVTNPLTREKIPVWVAGYVLMGYGTGAIMAVPAHDQRDFDFAKKNNLAIDVVIQGQGNTPKDPYEGEGVLIDSAEFTGLKSDVARSKITEYLVKHQIGSSKLQYHLRDWLISRQRYWGPPIPIIYCDKCGIVPIPEESLPVELPFLKEFQPKGTGKAPLAMMDEFINTKCPSCGEDAKRETDVSDTFLDSSWYFLRYPSTDIENKPFDADRNNKWLPVDMYIGGAEHAVLHLLYSRFVTMVLKDLGFIKFEEPFKKFRTHGLIIKDGSKMSKSKGNVVNPDSYVKEYGSDTLRIYLIFLGPYQEGGDFRDQGINGIYRFLQRIWGLFEKVQSSESSLKFEDLKNLHKSVKKVTDDIRDLKYNTAVSSLMEWLNFLSKKEKISSIEYETFLLLLAPFAPHITEELWEMLGEKFSIHKQGWPKFDEKYLVDEKVNIVVQVNGKLRDTVLIDNHKINDESFIREEVNKSPKVRKFLDNMEIIKTIYVAGKIFSFVVKNE